MLSDLRESGAIEQDADIVLFLYRDDYYNEDSEKRNIAECIVAKNRHGETGKVELRWMPEYTMARTFQNIRLWKSQTVLDNVLMAKHMRRTSNLFSATFRLNKKEEQRQYDEAMEDRTHVRCNDRR